MDYRLQQIMTWLPQVLGHEEFDVAPASADASFRRYFRVHYGDAGARHSAIVMDAPPGRENPLPFIAIARLLAGAGVHTPQVLAEDLSQGFLLLSDLGEVSYLQVLNGDTADALYGDALQALLKIQSIPTPVAKLPPYGTGLLWQEMALFRDWLLDRHLGISLTAAQEQRLEAGFQLLLESALAQPKVVVHRDYHSRNLMACEPRPGVIDFQDAVIGPLTYDLVSLLRDCYIRWPQARVEAWALAYYGQWLRQGGLRGISPSLFLRWFDLMGVQRHLKASGIFCRLHYRDQKSGYLKDIPLTFAYVLEACQRHDSLSDFYGLLQELAIAERLADAAVAPA
ncbi:MAG: phosphotransferase [Gammaproteobacteria bacterium]